MNKLHQLYIALTNYIPGVALHRSHVAKSKALARINSEFNARLSTKCEKCKVCINTNTHQL